MAAAFAFEGPLGQSVSVQALLTLLLPESAWPVDPVQFGRFLVAATLIEMTPGPNMGYLAIVAADQGRRAGLAVVAGVTVGLAVYMATASIGMAEVVMTVPAVYQALRWAGAVYLAWLAVEAWRSAGAAATAEQTGAPIRWSRLFGRGLVANLLNAKAAIFYVALLPGFIDPDHGHLVVQALLLGSAHLVIAAAVHCGIVLGATHFPRGLMQDGAKRLRVRRLFAVAIAATAIWLLWETRR